MAKKKIRLAKTRQDGQAPAKAASDSAIPATPDARPPYLAKHPVEHFSRRLTLLGTVAIIFWETVLRPVLTSIFPDVPWPPSILKEAMLILTSLGI